MSADVLTFVHRSQAKVAVMTKTPRKTHDPEAAPNRVRELRKAKGMTLQELAGRIGMAVSHLAKIERGLRDLNQQWMMRIAPHLGVEPADLLMPEEGGLTEDERALIATLRGLPAAMRSSYFALQASHAPYVGTPEIVPLHTEPEGAADPENDNGHDHDEPNGKPSAKRA